MSELQIILKDVQAERDMLLKQLKLEKQEKEGLLNKLRDLERETAELLDKIKEDYDVLKKEKDELEDLLFKAEEGLVEKDNQIKRLMEDRH